MKKKNPHLAPSPDYLRRLADALRWDRGELRESDFERFAAMIKAAADWIESELPQPRGRKDTKGTWSQVLMVRRLLSHKHVDNDADAIAAVAGACTGRDYERIARGLRSWRSGKRPRKATLLISDFNKVLSRLKRTHRMK